jgi:hypothetical protein
LQVGERVALEKAHKKAEDPLYAIELYLAMNAHHYRELHLSKPLLHILKLILGEKKAKNVLTGTSWVPSARKECCPACLALLLVSRSG